jgi:endogenous inhibitor of DNA gyrase (YacG/DUF329 family)
MPIRSKPDATCPTCGRLFISGDQSRRFACSTTCQEAHRLKIGAGRHAVVKANGDEKVAMDSAKSAVIRVGPAVLERRP